jgi:hypothetical protein
MLPTPASELFGLSGPDGICPITAKYYAARTLDNEQL